MYRMSVAVDAMPTCIFVSQAEWPLEKLLLKLQII